MPVMATYMVHDHTAMRTIFEMAQFPAATVIFVVTEL